MNRSEMRRCGKRYADAAEALRSKAGQVPGVEVETCRCGGVHLAKPPAAGNGAKTRKPVSGNTIPAGVRKKVTARDGGRCVKCGTARSLHQHHRRIKGHGGDPRPHTDCACNLVTLCETCHFWAHVSDPEAAKDEGLILPRETRQPGRTGVMIHASADIEDDCGTTRWPTCDGRWVREPMGAAA